MQYRNEEEINGDFYSDMRKIRKAAKEDMLDETFKKAEISKGLRPEEERKVTKKPFLKFGIVLIIIAVVSLAIISYLPWMCTKYNSQSGTIQELFYKDFENKEGDYFAETDYIFESLCTNCSNNSKNYIGLTKNDFTNTPRTTSYGFITLAILGLIFTIFAILDRMRNFSMEIVTVIHSSFAAAAFIVNTVIMILSIKFLGVYFLVYYNKPFIEASGINNLILIFPVPIILIVISLTTIMIAITVMRINFHEFEIKLRLDKPRSSISNFRHRRDI